MIRRPPRSTRTDTLFPYTTPFRSITGRAFLPCLPVRRAKGDCGAIGRPAGERREMLRFGVIVDSVHGSTPWKWRSEEHTSELQSLMRISYAVFCLKKKNKTDQEMMKHNTTCNYQNNSNQKKH